MTNYEKSACGYEGSRDEALVAYLYDEGDSRARAAFAAHLASCVACRRELSELRGVRRSLAGWAAPQPPGTLTDWSATASTAPSSRHRRRGSETLAAIPAWARISAAVVAVGIAAGLANVEVTFTDAGLVVRTGWSRPSGAGAASGAVGQSVPSPWRAELVALERRLRAELSPPADRRASGGPDGVEVMRQVRSLIDASERRQQRELALRVAEVARDVRLQREADLLRIDRSQRAIQQETGLEVLRNREMLDYLVRTSQR